MMPRFANQYLAHLLFRRAANFRHLSHLSGTVKEEEHIAHVEIE